MKKSLIILLVLTLFLLILIKSTLFTSKSVEPVTAAEKYLTSGLFNKYRLLSVKDCSLSFSDGTDAVIKAVGRSEKSPHETLKLNLFLTKNKKGIWTVKKIYPQ